MVPLYTPQFHIIRASVLPNIVAAVGSMTIRTTFNTRMTLQLTENQ